MNTIKIYLSESGRIADLQKDFPLYQGQFQNKLLNIFVPTSILAPVFSSSTADYVASSSVKVGMTYTARDGSIKVSKNYFMRYLKTLVYKNVEYALYERKLPKEFTFYAGQGANAPVLIANVVNIKQDTSDGDPVVISVVTSQTCHLDVMASTYLDKDEEYEPSELENLDAQVQAINAILPLKQDKQDENISLPQDNAEKTVVGAINKLGGFVKSTQSSVDDLKAEVGTLSDLTTDEKGTIVGAINEVKQNADSATSAAQQAESVANAAKETANAANATASSAKEEADSALSNSVMAKDTANEAKKIAQGAQKALGYETLQAFINATNVLGREAMKIGDNVYFREKNVPDLWVSSVEGVSVPYVYTDNDTFTKQLQEETAVQVGFFKFAYLETDGLPVAVAWQNMTASVWKKTMIFADYPYMAKIELDSTVNYSTVPQVIFGVEQALSGNYAPLCMSGDGCVYVYSKVTDEITIPTIITFAPDVNGVAVDGCITNKGLWSPHVLYNLNDMVYTAKGQYTCIEKVSSNTSPDEDREHWTPSYLTPASTTENALTFSGQNSQGTETQKSFNGSQAVEVAFNEDDFNVTENNGVLEISAAGGSAVPYKHVEGTLPTSGWEDTATPLIPQVAVTMSTDYAKVGELSEATRVLTTGWSVHVSGGLNRLYLQTNTSGLYIVSNSSESTSTENVYDLHYNDTVDFKFKINTTDGNVYIKPVSQSARNYYVEVKNVAVADWVYTISDEFIAVNSAVKMYLSDSGDIQPYAKANGSIRVIRSNVPTEPIPYKYEVEQTSTDGLFVIINDYIPEADIPTALPQTASDVKSGTLPTSGWTESDIKPYWDKSPSYVQVRGDYSSAIGTSTALGIRTQKNNDALSVYCKEFSATTFNWVTCTYNSVSEISGKSYKVYRDGSYGIRIFVSADGSLQAQGTGSIGRYVTWQIQKIGLSTESQKAYTISDTFITLNSDVLMELTDEGGVKAQALANGSITVIRDSVPTSPIPYTYKVKQTNASGQFTVLNHYVPTVPENLVKTDSANTFTQVQTFSNTDGFKSNRAENINGNAWYDFDGTSDRLGSLATPTILRTSEARPKAEVPNGSSTATKELAFLEDIQGGDWSGSVTSATIDAGRYEILYGQASNSPEGAIYTIDYAGTSTFTIYCQKWSSCSVVDGNLSIYTNAIQVTADGVLTIGQTLSQVKSDGTISEGVSSNQSFKYRKLF